MFCFPHVAPVASQYSNEVTFKPCLNNNMSKTILKDKNGVVRTLRVGVGAWDAPIILGHIAQIILNEGVGENVDLYHKFGGSGGVIHNMTGCLDAACTTVEDFPFVHMDFENWFTAQGDEILAAQPSALEWGYIGYDGQEGLYYKKTLGDSIWNKYQLPLAYYQTMNHPDRKWMEFFNTTSQITIPSDSGCRGAASTSMK